MREKRLFIIYESIGSDSRSADFSVINMGWVLLGKLLKLFIKIYGG